MIDANCQKVSAKARFDSDFRLRATVNLISLRASPARAQFEDQDSGRSPRQSRGGSHPVVSHNHAYPDSSYQFLALLD